MVFVMLGLASAIASVKTLLDMGHVDLADEY